jgi:hypothetical protein
MPIPVPVIDYYWLKTIKLFLGQIPYLIAKLPDIIKQSFDLFEIPPITSLICGDEKFLAQHVIYGFCGNS